MRLGVQLFQTDEPACSLAVWAHVFPRLVMYQEMLLGRDSWMCALKASHTALYHLDRRTIVFCGGLELYHHAPANVSTYTINPVAWDGGFHLRYEGAMSVTVSDEQQLLANSYTAMASRRSPPRLAAP